MSAVTGFRGAVSLAAILAVPHTLDSGALFPDRDLIVVITCGVILLTLLAWAVALIIFFPVLYTIITSFKTEGEARHS